MSEEWKLFQGIAYISNLGGLKGLNGEVRTPTQKNDGYMIFHSSQLNKMFRLHRAVAECFLPNPNNLPCVNHKDGDKTNNTVENLEWCDYSHNLQHAYDNGLHKSYIKDRDSNPHSKLSSQDVQDISTKYQHLSGAELGRMYGVTKEAIYYIRKNI